MKRALFITHDVSIYGASRSLQAITNNYVNKDFEIDLAITTSFRGKNDKNEISRLFNIKHDRIFEFHLPLSFCWANKPSVPLSIRIKNLLSRLLRWRLRLFISRNRYDLIYLNSLVLHSLITKNENYVIHVREVFDRVSSDVIEDLKKAKGIIFIDEATRNAFSIEFRNAIILNNPFDMRGVEKTNKLPGKFTNEPRTIISMLGQLFESKGTRFIIDSFLKSPENKNALLLIVGKGDAQYLEDCKKQADNAPNVIFYGEEAAIEKIYGVSDFIIRGESIPCIGRTVYEGLYSGCEVIMPGYSSGNMLGLEDRFINSVHFYEPRNTNSLVHILNQCIGRKITERKYHSNIDQYIRQFDSFLTTATE